MADEKKIPRRQSAKDLETALLTRIDQWIKEGCTPEEALEKLTIKQYDFLIDRDVNLDNLTMTSEQQKAVKEVMRSARPTGLTYKKKYPESKQELYRNLVEFVKAQGGVIHEREKMNFRDLDFDLNGVHNRIVLSNPRPKKT
jgi:hypothetical protein